MDFLVIKQRHVENFVMLDITSPNIKVIVSYREQN